MPPSSPLPKQGSLLFDESFIKGVDKFSDPGNLRPGECITLDNFYVDNVSPYGLVAGESPYGIRGGPVLSRPGVAGQLATPHANPVVSPLPFLNAGVTDLLYASGSLSVTSGGKLYKYVQGATTDTEVLIGGVSHFSFNTMAYGAARQGLYAYLIGNSDGLFYRTSLTTTEVVPALNPPTAAPVASLTSTVLDPANDASKWSSFPALSWPNSTPVAASGSIGGPQTIILQANQRFARGTASPSVYPTGWLTGGDTMGFQTASVGGLECYLDVGANAEWVDWDYPTPTYPTGQNTINNARVWLASAYAHSTTGGKFQMLAFPEDASVTSQTLVVFSDLVIVAGGSTSTITSAAFPFVTADVAKVITVFGGTGFVIGNFTITAVNNSTHVATVNGNIGTTASTGGIGTKNLDSGGPGAGGDQNFTLANPPSAIAGGSQSTSVLKALGSLTEFNNVFSFSALAKDFDYIKYRLSGPASNTQCGVNTPSLQAVDVRLLPSVQNGALNLAANNPVGMGANCLGGVWIKRDYTGSTTTYTDLAVSGADETKVTSAGHPFQVAQVGQILVITGGTNWIPGNYVIKSVNGSHVATLSAVAATSTSATGGTGTAYNVKDYSTNNLVDIGFSAPATTPAGAIQWRLGFLQAGQPMTAIQWSNAAAYTPAGTSFYCDISTIGATVRSQTAFLFLQITSDLPATVDPTNLCTVGPILGSGNLSVSPVGIAASYAPIFYIVTEVNDAGDVTIVNIIESDGSPTSASLQPTAISAVAQLVFAPPVNASTTHFSIYRFGGIWQDGYGRLIATVPITSDIAFGGDTLSRDQSNPYYTWNHTTRTLTDNTPDSFLFSATVYEFGRQSPPVGAQAIAAWQGRIWQAVGSTLYGSWSVQANIEAGLYCTTIALPTDPEIATKGFTYTITGADDDPIMALVPAPTGELLVFKQLSVYKVVGTDPTNFEVIPVCPSASVQGNGGGGVGLAAAKGWAVDAINQCVYFLAANGVWKYSGGTISYMSTNLKGVLDQSVINNPVTWGRISMAMHDFKLYVFAPSSSTDTTNTIAWVYDTFLGTWSRNTGAAYQFTGAASLSASTDANGIFYTGFDGQVYIEDDWADVPIPGDLPTPITCTLQTRAIGRDPDGGTGRYTDTIPNRYYIAGVTGESVPITVTVGPLTYNGAASPSNSVDKATLPPSVFGHDNSVATSARGQLVTMTVQAQTTAAQFKLQALALSVAEGSVFS